MALRQPIVDNPFPQGILPPLNDRDRSPMWAPASERRRAITETAMPRPGASAFSANCPSAPFDVHYWGNKGTGLLTTWNINQIPNQYLALGSQSTDKVTIRFRPDCDRRPSGPTTSRQQLLRPYPQYWAISSPAGFRVERKFDVSRRHDSGERRFVTNLTFLAAYTRSKAIDDVHQDYYNRTIEKAVVIRCSQPVCAERRLSASIRTRKAIWAATEPGLECDCRKLGRERNSTGPKRSADRYQQALGQQWPKRQARSPRNLTRSFGDKCLYLRLDLPSETSGPYCRTSVPSSRCATWIDRSGEELLVKHQGQTDYGSTSRAILHLFNHPQFPSPNTSVSSQSFGQITSQANNPRDIQIGLKVKF